MLPVAVPETAKDMTTAVVGLLLPLTRLMVIGVPKLPSLMVSPGGSGRVRSNTAWGILDSITMATMQKKECTRMRVGMQQYIK